MDNCRVANKGASLPKTLWMPPHLTRPNRIAVMCATTAIVLVAVLVVQRNMSDPITVGLVLMLAAIGLLACWRWRRSMISMALRRDFRAAAVWDQSPLGLMLYDPFDPAGVVRILDCNERAAQLHGYTREELIGQDLDILETTPWKHLREEWFDNLQRNLVASGESEHKRKDGTVFPTEYFTCLVTVGKQQLVIGMDHDATARKAAETALVTAKEEAEAANRAKSDFLAVMSHEIRTPMNGIIGFTNLLEETSLDSEQRDWLNTIRQSGETLLTLINDILDFSKIESGKMDLDHFPTAIDQTIEEVVGMLWSKANEKKIELLGWVDPELPAWVLTDGSRLRQILLNLVGNAIKFTHEGEIEVRAEPGAPTAKGDPTLRIQVRDTGIGIPADRVDRLFKPFSQADSSTTRQYGGTGLGLVISRRLAELLGGTAELTSTSEKGSVFSVVIAAPPTDPPPGSDGLAYVDEAHIDLRGKVALLVDDNQTNLRILANLLDRWGMHTRTYVTPQQALTELRAKPDIDLVLVDMMMPEMNGIQWAEAVRKDFPPNEFPIILLSSVGTNELRRVGDLTVFESVIHKPIRMSAMLDTVMNALVSRSGSRAPSNHPLPEPAKEKLADTHPLKILVAEDNPVNQKLIKQVLHRFGYEAKLVPHGRAGLQAVKDEAFDLILMDCQMPQLDGYETTRRIRRGDAGEDRRDVPIVALTASAMVGDREQCIAAGMNDYLSKPIRAQELQSILESAFRGEM